MNPLTQIKNTQKATQREIAAGFSDSASWHYKYRHSAYIFAGGLPFELTEGDLLAVFAQYGEIVDVNLVRCASAAAPWCMPVHSACTAGWPASACTSAALPARDQRAPVCSMLPFYPTGLSIQGQGHRQAPRLCLPGL